MAEGNFLDAINLKKTKAKQLTLDNALELIKGAKVTKGTGKVYYNQELGRRVDRNQMALYDAKTGKRQYDPTVAPDPGGGGKSGSAKRLKGKKHFAFQDLGTTMYPPLKEKAKKKKTTKPKRKKKTTKPKRSVTKRGGSKVTPNLSIGGENGKNGTPKRKKKEGYKYTALGKDYLGLLRKEKKFPGKIIDSPWNSVNTGATGIVRALAQAGYNAHNKNKLLADIGAAEGGKVVKNKLGGYEIQKNKGTETGAEKANRLKAERNLKAIGLQNLSKIRAAEATEYVARKGVERAKETGKPKVTYSYRSSTFKDKSDKKSTTTKGGKSTKASETLKKYLNPQKKGVKVNIK